MLNHPDINQTKYISEFKNFAIGGLSGIIATSATLPLDYLKVQIQSLSEGRQGPRPSAIQLSRDTFNSKGLHKFYSGLSSAIARQAVYATSRLGLYKFLVDREQMRTGSEAISFWLKFYFSTLSGALSAVLANPCDIVLVRIQTDHLLPIEQRRNYSGIFDALLRIPREEGVLAYWRASTPTVLRACALNFGMLVPYDQCKEYMDKKLGYNSMNRIYSTLFAAVCACLVSLPFDNVKVKCQIMVPDANGKFPYSGFLDCAVKSFRREGALGLYAGFFVYVGRVGPNVIITLLTLDFIHYLLG